MLAGASGERVARFPGDSSILGWGVSLPRLDEESGEIMSNQRSPGEELFGVCPYLRKWLYTCGGSSADIPNLADCSC
jgi:hypothetical protein